jgi:hypothetical protein
MEDSHQHMIIPCQPQQPCPQWDLRRQVKRFSDHVGYHGGHVRLPHPDHGQFPGQLIHPQDVLVGLPVRGAEDRSQHFMP